MHVIGAGFPRTGTSSLKAALERLGFGPCHHMYEVIARPEDQIRRWLHALSAESARAVDWEWVLEGYASSVDWPSSFFWRELARAYPEAKVVLTVRDPRRWHASVRDTIYHAAFPEESGYAVDPLPALAEFRPALRERMWIPTFGMEFPDEAGAVELFERHTAAVRAAVPAERLLVYEVGQGWQPLCEFLGVDPPPGEPFPRLNDTAAITGALRDAAETGTMPTPFDSPGGVGTT